MPTSSCTTGQRLEHDVRAIHAATNDATGTAFTIMQAQCTSFNGPAAAGAFNYYDVLCSGPASDAKLLSSIYQCVDPTKENIATFNINGAETTTCTLHFSYKNNEETVLQDESVLAQGASGGKRVQCLCRCDHIRNIPLHMAQRKLWDCGLLACWFHCQELLLCCHGSAASFRRDLPWDCVSWYQQRCCAAQQFHFCCRNLGDHRC
jgi:hypothetical protein